jgi:hypothetical protein
MNRPVTLRSWFTAVALAIAAATAACGSEAQQQLPPPVNPEPGSKRDAGRGATNPMTPAPPDADATATGGRGGSGGSSGAGVTGGSGGVDASGPPASDTGDTVMADAAVAPPADAPAADGGPSVPPPGGCSTTPAADAATIKLAFRRIEMTVPASTGGKSSPGLTELRFFPGSSTEFLLSQKGGNISHFRIEGERATLVRGYRVPGVYAEDDCGLVSIALDPGFASNRYVYAGYCSAVNRSRVTRFTIGGDTLAGAVDVIGFNAPGGNTAWHAVGSMGFDPQGNMWLLHGEFTVSANAQNRNSVLGKLLRIRPNAAGGYTPAPGNAFAGGGGDPAVYALGLRSPWRGLLDGQGRFLIGDVGDTSNEELNLVSRAGQNFGWDGSRSGPVAGPGLTTPLATYRNGASDPYMGRDGDEALESRAGRAIWVGAQYRSCGTSDRYGGALTGVYLFGDWYTGWVRGAVIDGDGRKTTDRLLASFANLSSWDQAADGYLYAVKFGQYGTGGNANEQPGLYRVERAP